MTHKKKEILVLQFIPAGHKIWRVSCFATRDAVKRTIAEMTATGHGVPPQIRKLYSVDPVGGKWFPIDPAML